MEVKPDMKLQVGIETAFVADGGVGTVARKDTDVVGEGQYLGADAIDKGCRVAAGKVGATNAALKQRVPSEEEFVLGKIETKPAWGVAGRMEHTEAHLSQRQLLPVCEIEINGDKGSGHLHVEPLASHRWCKIIDGLLEGMAQGTQSVKFMQEREAEDVVEVHVGLQGKTRKEMVFLDEMVDFCLLSVSIDSTIDNGTLKRVVPHKEAILPDGVRNKSFNVHKGR